MLLCIKTTTSWLILKEQIYTKLPFKSDFHYI